MILAFDTFYYDDKAKTVAIEFNNWEDNLVVNVFEETLSGINTYTPGEFYKRELPCILSLLKKINLVNCNAIIIDGFVILDDKGKLGLGGHLYKSLNSEVPIIGVAKNNFSSLKKNKKSLFRGSSKKPLFVTTLGIDLDNASDKIKSMHGNYRIPELLKKVDSLGRIVGGLLLHYCFYT